MFIVQSIVAIATNYIYALFIPIANHTHQAFSAYLWWLFAHGD
jgi:hypothetical protein